VITTSILILQAQIIFSSKTSSLQRFLTKLAISQIGRLHQGPEAITTDLHAKSPEMIKIKCLQ